MTDHHSHDVSSLEAGKFLPGISLPLQVSEGGPSRHAFDGFVPLQVDGLSPLAKKNLYQSFADVVQSLDQLHQQWRAFGNVTLKSFHNRGTASEPLATLWIDSGKPDDVHSGDPESMYFTEDRLRHGKPATPSDDWYALGIVLAEVALGTAAVAKIWQLCRQDGKFTEKLLKNLKRSRGNHAIRKTAIRLIESSLAQSVEPQKFAIRIASQQTNRTALRISFAASLLTLFLTCGSLYLSNQAIKQRQQELQNMETMLKETEGKIAELEQAAAQQKLQPPPEPPPNVPQPPVVNPEIRQQRRWQNEIAGLALMEAIAQAEASTPDGESFPNGWVQSLRQVAAMKGQKQWRLFDQPLRLRVQRFVDEPWDRVGYENVVSRIDALNEAHSRWSTWARSDKSLDRIKEQHSLMASGRVKDFLGDWLAQAIETRQFELEIVNAANPNAIEGVNHVVGFETSNDSESKKWDWTVSEGERATTTLKVDSYLAGDRMRVWLQIDGTLWNSTVIDHTFASPLLLWQLSKNLKLEDSASGYALWVYADAPYGPPIKLETLTLTGSELESNGTPSSIGQKVVDPLESLPF
ncbi:hypothetical protein LOC67_03980 [Stieleria sp. JC731]|uniref:hypothetical protein n=1 Tax=Pirellulaceae TaxID=2691357 RepID=UPI001E3881B5|nr:hypothetical protein [Stieleria sp. JC731]MCC9599710.1 hypothetical protein [Stieleria sp. JC731]